MNWYSANLLFESTHSDGSTAPNLWEESIVLVSAEEVDSARRLAEHLGRKREARYPATGAGVVTWEFRRVDRLFEVQGPLPGVGLEVFSRYLRAEVVTSLLTPFGDEE